MPACSVALYDPRLQPARLCPWNFPGKNTGVGCHFLLQEGVSTQREYPEFNQPGGLTGANGQIQGSPRGSDELDLDTRGKGGSLGEPWRENRTLNLTCFILVGCGKPWTHNC